MYKLNILDKISFVLVILGAINMGLIGVADVNFFNVLFGSVNVIERIVYILVGVSGLNLLIFVLKTKSIKISK
ncbi:DUF378 domain-containing protein [Clostridium amazonitimonense]|uniref:DUF378 domain-containing protein n=1 Tax=Clostridium amazonitimonense TaxID=1499689 RepID=UPI000509D3FC|nr:DUF378 domain-containing protein [Clostridium amazonitimonense]